MARKYDLISELYNRTCKTVVSNPQNWQAFLASACRNYKLRYDEQLLVYAQRPDATAVLEIEQWNKIFGRWVNRGARGIAVFADENRSRQRLTHYFDISDTHESRYSRTVPIWDMRQEYEADVIETLESTFGEIENKSSLAEAIMGAARNAAEDNIPDYLQDLYYATEGSSFEEVEEDIVAFIYKNVVANSVAYMMMSRLGVDTDGYFELDDFRDVTNFNTQETLNALGFATSDIAEMGLYEKALFFLEIVRPLNNITYNIEYINCLANSRDIRAIYTIHNELNQLAQLRESEITDSIIFYHNFLRRRRAYTFVDMGRLDDAEEAFKEMLNEGANKEYAKGELEYIQELKKLKGINNIASEE